MTACLFRLSGIILASALWEIMRSELSALILSQFYDVKRELSHWWGFFLPLPCLGNSRKRKGLQQFVT